MDVTIVAKWGEERERERGRREEEGGKRNERERRRGVEGGRGREGKRDKGERGRSKHSLFAPVSYIGSLLKESSLIPRLLCMGLGMRLA